MLGEGDRQGEWRGRLWAIGALGTLTAGFAGTLVHPTEALADETSTVVIENQKGAEVTTENAPDTETISTGADTAGQSDVESFQVAVVVGDIYRPESSEGNYQDKQAIEAISASSAVDNSTKPDDDAIEAAKTEEVIPTPEDDSPAFEQPEESGNSGREQNDTPQDGEQQASTTPTPEIIAPIVPLASGSDVYVPQVIPKPLGVQKTTSSSIQPASPDQASGETWNPAYALPDTIPAGSPTTPPVGNQNPAFEFPLVVTKQQLENRSPHWDTETTENRHHDYPAADIFADPGTEVIAPVSGTITKVVDDGVSSFGSNVELLSDEVLPAPDDNPATPDNAQILFYITHMEDDSVTVTEGQHVQPGDHLGIVGGNDDANGTSAHEHIDGEIYGENGVTSRANCSGVECQDNYPFINIQALLHGAFQELPDATPAPPVPTPAEPAARVGVRATIPTITPAQFTAVNYGGDGAESVETPPVVAAVGIDASVPAWNPSVTEAKNPAIQGSSSEQIPNRADTPPSPESQVADFDVQRAAFQAALAEQESNFVWDDDPNQDNCSGGYQYAAATWANYAGYAEAYLAPPRIQYQSALEDVTYYFNKFNGDWRSVAMAWYAGPGFMSKNIDVPIQEIDGEYPSIAEYANQVLAKMQKYLANPQAIPSVPGVSESISNPSTTS